VRNPRPPGHAVKQGALRIGPELCSCPIDEGLVDVIARNSSTDGVDEGSSGDGFDPPFFRAGSGASALLRDMIYLRRRQNKWLLRVVPEGATQGSGNEAPSSGFVNGERAASRRKAMPTKKKADAIMMLKEDHRTVEGLFTQFHQARGKERKHSIAQQICTELIIHTMIEEEIFYPALRGKIEDDMLDEAHVEHDSAKMLIAELMASDPDASFYDAKVTVLCEEIRHHVKEEERPSSGMFSQARNAEVDMAALAEQMLQRKEALKTEFKEKGLPTPVTRSLSGATLKFGEPVAAMA
jgi:hypothetical protein